MFNSLRVRDLLVQSYFLATSATNRDRIENRKLPRTNFLLVPQIPPEFAFLALKKIPQNAEESRPI